MVIRHLHPILLFLPLLIAALTDTDKNLILEKHNFFRSQTDPPASDMRAMTWSSDLEELAKSYAEKCIWDHNENRGFRGENLFLMSGSSLDVGKGMDDWHNERNAYNFTANTCQIGEMCGHYTQMVWAQTTRIGCGDKFCEKIEGFEDENMHLLVCNYEPPGNFQGQQPFKTGAPCSACPETDKCMGSLCVDVNAEQMESSTNLPDTTSEQALDTGSELVPYTVELAPEKQIELTSYATTAKTEPDATPPLPISSSPPVPTTILSLVPDTPTSPAVPTTIISTTTPAQIMDITPSSPLGSSFRSPQTPRDSSPQMALGTTDDSSSVLPATTSTDLNQGPGNADVNYQPTQIQKDNRITEESGVDSYTDSPLTSTRSSGDYTVSPKTNRILETISTVPSTPEHPSIPVMSPSPPQTTTDQAFSNDGPNIGEIHTLTTISNDPPYSKKPADEGVAVSVGKDPTKGSPVKATPKTLQSPLSQSKELIKGQKDKQNAYMDTSTAQKLNKKKEKSKHKSKFTLFPKKDPLKPNFFSKGVKWHFNSGFSERSYFGKHVYRPRFGQAPRPLCPYPCLNPPSMFPLYRTNKVSPWGDQYQKDWSANKPNTKKPCNLSGYKRGIYSLYLSSSNMEENLTKPKS